MNTDPAARDEESSSRVSRRLAERPRGALSLSAFTVAFAAALVFKLAVEWMAAGIPFGILIVVVAAVPLFNHFFEIIEHRSLGHAGWPVLSWESLVTFRRQLSFVLFAAVIATALLRSLLVAAGLVGLGDGLSLCVILVLPVAAAVLAVTKRPAKAANPLFLIRTIARLEAGYFAIMLASVAWWGLARIAWARQSALLLAGATLGLLLLGFLIGSIVYASRARLGLRTARSPEALAEREAAEQRRVREHVLGTAWSFASRGNIDGAVAHVRDSAQDESDALAAEVWMFHRMARWQSPAAALRYGSQLRTRLRDAGRDREAAKVEVVCEALRRAQTRNEAE